MSTLWWVVVHLGYRLSLRLALAAIYLADWCALETERMEGRV